MPADRFWEIEEGDVYLGGIEAGPEDLARVAVAGYGVVYGNDWLTVPISIPYGTLTTITELTVLDDFGRVTNIPSAAEVDGGGPGRAFKFFELTGDDNPARNRSPLLFLPPTVETTDAGRPLEDVRFLRDELANLAWAVEQRVESVAGRPIDLAARRRLADGRATASRGGPSGTSCCPPRYPNTGSPSSRCASKTRPARHRADRSCSNAAGCRGPASQASRAARSDGSSSPTAGCSSTRTRSPVPGSAWCGATSRLATLPANCTPGSAGARVPAAAKVTAVWSSTSSTEADPWSGRNRTHASGVCSSSCRARLFMQ